MSDEYGCTAEATGCCSCLDATPTTDALVARAERDLATNRLLWAKWLYTTGRVSEWSLLWQRP